MSDALIHGLTGAISGVVSGVIFYPLESIRTQLQAIKEKNVKYYDFLVDLHAREGPLALYAGLGTFLVCNVSSLGFYYFFYQIFYKLILKNRTQGVRIIDYILVSTAASVANVFVNAPVWLVSTRMTLKQDPTPLACIQSVYKNEGLLGFFKGIKPTLMLIANPIIQFVMFDWLKAYLKASKGGASTLRLFLYGAYAKLIATLVTYPLQTIKTRMHVDKSQVPASFLEIIQQIAQNEGMAGFYKGMGAKIVQTVM